MRKRQSFIHQNEQASKVAGSGFGVESRTPTSWQNELGGQALWRFEGRYRAHEKSIRLEAKSDDGRGAGADSEVVAVALRARVNSDSGLVIGGWKL